MLLVYTEALLEHRKTTFDVIHLISLKANT